MRLSKKALKALEESINNWNCRALDMFVGIGDARLDCPLCMLYNNDNIRSIGNECIQCPIAKKVDRRYCKNTPYTDWWDAETFEEQYDAIEAEINFLCSLLPKTHKLVQEYENTEKLP